MNRSDQSLSSAEHSASESGPSVAHGNLEPWLESLPMAAFLEHGEEIIAVNDLARNLVGTRESIAVDQVFLGTYPAVGDERRQRFDCLLSPIQGPITMVSGVVQPCEAAGAGVRLVLLLESQQDSGNGAANNQESQSTFLEDLFDMAPEAMAVVQLGRILRVNREFERLFGYSSANCLGASLFDLVVPEGRYHETEMMLHMVETEGRASMESVRRVRSGQELDVSIAFSRVRLGGGRMGHCVTYRDIRHEKQMQAKLQHTALHDPLTGLANRVLFMDRLSLTLARLRRRPDRNFAVIFLDLDHFKRVNDTWGHAAGDTLLLAITARLRACLRPQDTVARFGGDEFALVVDEVGCREDIEIMADRIQRELQLPIDVGAGRVNVSASMGIVLGSIAYNDVEDLLHDADGAMYRAKQQGKARHVFFDSKNPAPTEAESPSPVRHETKAA